MTSPKDINIAIRAYLMKEGLTMTDVANRLGVSSAAVTNQLSGERPFGRNSAAKYAREFGFNISYLMTGEGSLFGELEGKESGPKEQPQDGVFIPRETLDLYTSLARSCETLSALVDRLTGAMTAPQKSAAFLDAQWRAESKK